MQLLDDAFLLHVTGGFPPEGSPKGGSAGGTQPPSLGLHAPSFGGDAKPPACEKKDTWNTPHGTAITGDGGLVQLPFASCPAFKRPAVPKI